MNDTISVLLVENDPADLLATTMILEDVPGTTYEITSCNGFRATKKYFEENADARFDVCMINFRLNRYNGFDVLKYMVEGHQQTPCVMLTEVADVAADRRAMKMGAADYLVKGRFDSETIERVLRYTIDNARVLNSLKESEARFRSVVESASDGIVLLDDDGTLLATNRAANELLGASTKNLVGRSCVEFLTEESGTVVTEQLAGDGNVGGPGSGMKPMETHVIHATGKLVPVELTVSSWVSAGDRYWSIIIRDLTERKEMSDKLVYQAFHDPLTGLANRTLLKERVVERFRTIRHIAGTPALILIDLDNFKLVNDTFGHEAGDELLIVVATRLRECVREAALVARVGSDEFAVLLNGCESLIAAKAVAQRLIDSLAEPVTIGGLPIIASGSAGVAIVASAEVTPDALFRNAEVAMHSAKANGKNRMALFEESMHHASFERMRMEHDLRATLAADALQVAYQPVVSLTDGSVHGFEALARWTDPERGVVPPDIFIAVAEDAGLIEQLGRTVMKRAVEETAALQTRDQIPYQINVNLSTRQLDDRDLVSFTRALLEDSGLAPGTLTLEVTESVMVGHVERAIGVLNELRDLQVKLALDDFGTGYSSLSYLHMLPLDALKADRSFVTRYKEPSGRALLKAILAVGRSLDLHTVAEGIEDENERSALAGMGYDYGQGYLFSKPVTLLELAEYLERAKTTARWPA